MSNEILEKNADEIWKVYKILRQQKTTRIESNIVDCGMDRDNISQQQFSKLLSNLVATAPVGEKTCKAIARVADDYGLCRTNRLFATVTTIDVEHEISSAIFAGMMCMLEILELLETKTKEDADNNKS